MIAALRELRRMNAETRVITTVTQVFNQLAKQTDLSPRNPVVNKLLSTLVQTLVDAEEQDSNKANVLNDPTVKAIRPHLLDLLSRAEYEMEMYFSEKFAAAATLQSADLDRFWYRDNYRDLIAQEVRGLHVYTDINTLMQDNRPAVFVGAGPLPLSAIDLNQRLGKKCVCVELDPAAAKTGQAMIDKLGLSDQITYITADGRDVDYSPYSLIMVASLVSAKAGVFARINETAPNATVAVRSAEGLKTLLYEPVDIADIESKGFKYHGTAKADKRTVNATCFFSRRTPQP